MERRVVDRAALKRLRAEVGGGLPRLIGYFEEDGLRAIAALERAVRERNAAAMVIPAHSMKGDALQFGAGPLALLAESIEQAARRCVETHGRPDGLVSEVLALRPLLQRTVAALAHEAGMDAPQPAPPPAGIAAATTTATAAAVRTPPARPVFGRKATPGPR